MEWSYWFDLVVVESGFKLGAADYDYICALAGIPAELSF